MIIRGWALLFCFAIAFFAPSTHAGETRNAKIEGKIISFDEKFVRVKSGGRIFEFTKQELKLPSYQTGQDVEVSLTKEEMARFFGKRKALKHAPGTASRW